MLNKQSLQPRIKTVDVSAGLRAKSSPQPTAHFPGFAEDPSGCASNRERAALQGPRLRRVGVWALAPCSGGQAPDE